MSIIKHNTGDHMHPDLYDQTECVVKVFGRLSDEQWERVHNIINQDPGPHKEHGEFYVFEVMPGWNLSMESRLLRYLVRERLTHEVIVTRRHTPKHKQEG